MPVIFAPLVVNGICFQHRTAARNKMVKLTWSFDAQDMLRALESDDMGDPCVSEQYPSPFFEVDQADILTNTLPYC